MNNMPTNLQYLLKSLSGNSTPVNNSNSNFSQDELNALRQAYLNAEKRKAEWANQAAKYGPPVDEEAAGYYLMMKNPYIHYMDYNMGGLPQSYDDKNVKTILSNSLKSPAYRMSSTIGQAHYSKDKNGNVIIRDVYNFPKGSNTNSKGLQLLHRLGENIGAQYPIQINLGNPNTWNLR